MKWSARIEVYAPCPTKPEEEDYVGDMEITAEGEPEAVSSFIALLKQRYGLERME